MDSEKESDDNLRENIISWRKARVFSRVGCREIEHWRRRSVSLNTMILVFFVGVLVIPLLCIFFVEETDRNDDSTERDDGWFRRREIPSTRDQIRGEMAKDSRFRRGVKREGEKSIRREREEKGECTTRVPKTRLLCTLINIRLLFN